jgi:hypothetical protein
VASRLVATAAVATLSRFRQSLNSRPEMVGRPLGLSDRPAEAKPETGVHRARSLQGSGVIGGVSRGDGRFISSQTFLIWLAEGLRDFSSLIFVVVARFRV